MQSYKNNQLHSQSRTVTFSQSGESIWLVIFRQEGITWPFFQIKYVVGFSEVNLITTVQSEASTPIKASLFMSIQLSMFMIIFSYANGLL